MIFALVLMVYIELIQKHRKIKKMSENETRTSTCIYISNFPRKTTREELDQLLRTYGSLISLQIIQKPDCTFAFAEFDDIRDAAFAVKQLNQKLYQGMNLKVEFKKKGPKEKSHREEGQSKKQNDKNLESPNSNIETSCNLPTKNTPKYRQQRSSYRNQNRRDSRRSVDSRISSSQSRSREKKCLGESKRVGSRDEGSRCGYEEERRAQNIKYRSGDLKYHPHEDYKLDSQIRILAYMMKHLERNLERMEEKLEDLLAYQRREEKFYSRRGA